MFLGRIEPGTTVTSYVPSGTHIVNAGDNLWNIAQKYYSDSSLWNIIAKANGIMDPTKLRIGMTLSIPPKPFSAIVKTSIPAIPYTPTQSTPLVYTGGRITPKIIDHQVPVKAAMTQNQKTALTIGGVLAAMMLLGG